MFGKKKNVQAAESEVSGVQGAEETAKAEAPAQISASELKEFEEFKRQKKLTGELCGSSGQSSRI